MLISVGARKKLTATKFSAFFQSISPKICSGEDQDDPNELDNDDKEKEDNDNKDDEDTMMRMTVGLLMKW